MEEQILKTEFCKECNNFINLPLDEDYIFCEKCGVKTNITEYNFKSIKTFKSYSSVQKNWLINYNKKKEKNKKEKKDNIKFDIIDQPCVNDNCDSNRCYYTAAQLRSADEGQTIFYQCIKCSERFTLNN